ncbi:MAG: RNA polymerase sigma factor [Planctomycetota bacterium]|jgi:RNA polymerase sigma-70 factor (ECF subfamily)
MRSDKELLRRIVERDESAFDELFARYHHVIRGRFKSMVRCEAAADDLVQELFLRLWTRADQYAGRGPVEGWLQRIATNLALNYLRWARRRRTRPLEGKQPPAEGEQADQADWMIDPGSFDPEEIVELAERRKMLERLVGSLPEAKLRLYRMVHEQEIDVQAAAELLGIPVGTAKSRLHYLRRWLAQAWKELGEDWENP